jgi:hypothetical protein
MAKILQPPYMVTLVQKTQKNIFSVAVGGGIGDFTYQMILQSIFMTKKYKLKNISKIIFNIYSWAACHFQVTLYYGYIKQIICFD